MNKLNAIRNANRNVLRAFMAGKELENLNTLKFEGLNVEHHSGASRLRRRMEVMPADFRDSAPRIEAVLTYRPFAGL